MGRLASFSANLLCVFTIVENRCKGNGCTYKFRSSELNFSRLLVLINRPTGGINNTRIIVSMTEAEGSLK